MAQRNRGTSVRPMNRVLEQARGPCWLIDSDGKLAYLSARCAPWLNCDLSQLLGCSTRSISAGDQEGEAIGLLARSLAAPDGLRESSYLCRKVSPAVAGAAPAQPLETLFIALDDTATSILALASHRPAEPLTADQVGAAEIFARLQRWWRELPAWSQLPVCAGDSAEGSRLRRQLKIAAAVDEHLLLVGPAGCGSEVAARVLAAQHRSAVSAQASNLAAQIVTIDGSLMDGDLLEVALDPATQVLEESGQSRVAIILRDLDQTPLDVQQTLGIWCQRHAGRVRLLALSASTMRELVSQQQVSALLQPMLNVLQIRFAGLASRVADIAVIATAVLQQRRKHEPGLPERFSRTALDHMLVYPWPRNMAELEAAVRQAANACPAAAILPEHLPLAIRSFKPQDPTGRRWQGFDLDDALEQFERQWIRRALHQARGNRAEAARLLNISRARLLRRLDEADDAESNR